MNLKDAAQMRATKMRQHVDRPSKRRSGEDMASSSRVSARLTSFDLRAEGDANIVEFDGYASVTGSAYEMWDWYGPYREIVDPGAFGETLAQSDLDVPFVLEHNQLRRIARTTLGTLVRLPDPRRRVEP